MSRRAPSMGTARGARPLRAALALLLLACALAPNAWAQARVGDLTRRAGDVPRRLVGYSLVTGLDGTGDRSFGGATATTPTVRSVVNLLRRFGIEVPASQLRLRDVAAVMVTAEVSPWLRAGGRFEVQVSALGDASSLRGGVLWITPLVTDPNQPAVATAQGALSVASSETGRTFARANSGRIPAGGVLESDPPALVLTPKLLLREPDLATASRIAQAIQAAYGADAAAVEDPGSLALTLPKDKFKGKDAEALGAFLTAVDTLPVFAHAESRVVIDAREGTVVAGGDVRIGPAVVSHHGITLTIAPGGMVANAPEGMVRAAPGAPVQDVAAGLHATGARPEEIAAIFQALESAGALRAEVLVR